MRVLSTDVVVVGGGAAGCYAALNLHRQGIKSRHRLQGPGRQERRVDLRRQPGDLGPRARQHRGAGPQHRRIPHQVPQPVPDRSALGARAAASGSRTSTTRSSRKPGLYLRRDDQGNVVTSPGQDPQCRRQHPGQFRRAVHGPAAQAGHQGRHPAPGGNRRHRAAAQAGRLGRAACSRSTSSPANIRSCSAAPSSSRPDIPTGCTRARPARAKCRPTASRWRGAPARRWSTSKCSGGTPTTLPTRRPGSACRSIPIRCSARRSRRAWSTRRARSSSTSSRTIRSPSGPIRCSSRRWRSRSTPARRATTAATMPASTIATAREVEAYTSYGKSFRQLGLRFPEDLVEAAVTAHYRQGGIDVDTKTMRSSVPGLYVAGGLGGHSNGLIALATYDGKVVADGVAADLPRLDSRHAARGRRAARGAAARCACWHHATRWRAGRRRSRNAIRALMWDKVGVEKDDGEPEVGAARTSRTSGSTCCRA